MTTAELSENPSIQVGSTNFPIDRRNPHGIRRILAAAGIATAVITGGVVGINTVAQDADSDNRPGVTELDLSEEGKIEVLSYGEGEDSYRTLFATEATVVAIDKNEDQKQIILWVAVPGEIATKKDAIEHVEGGGPEIPAKAYSGITVGFSFDQNASVFTDSFIPTDPLGTGVEGIEEFVKVGDEIGGITADLTFSDDSAFTQAQVEQNQAALQAMESSLGQSLPITDRNFVFSSNDLVVNSTP